MASAPRRRSFRRSVPGESTIGQQTTLRMMRKKMQPTMVVLTVLMGAASGKVAAHDLLAPCWRGQAGSSFQRWQFGSSGNPSGPDATTNVCGIPQAAIAVGPFGEGWQFQLRGYGTNQTGYWDLGRTGTITLTISNCDETTPTMSKLVWVQVAQFIDGGIYADYAAIAVAGAVFLGGQRRLVESVASGGSWWVDRTLWQLNLSPALTSVVITSAYNGSLIDEAVVDTLSGEGLCPPNVVLAADLGQCSKSNVTWTLPVTSGCTLTNSNCTPPSGSTFPAGITGVTCTSADALGIAFTCRFTVTVRDSGADPLVVEVRRLSATNNVLEICWPVTCVTYALESTTNGGDSGSWSPLGAPAQTNGNRICVRTVADERMRWFRLKGP